MTSSPTTPTPRRNARATHTGWRSLGRHYVEMVLAMLAGMLVIGMGRDALGLSVPFAERPGAWYLLMATDMSLAMAAWMRYRRHSWASTLEMCAAMYLPAALVPLMWVDLMDTMTFMGATHGVMLLAMFAVLLHRRDEYSCKNTRRPLRQPGSEQHVSDEFSA